MGPRQETKAQVGPMEALRAERKPRPLRLMKSAPPTLMAGSALLRRRRVGSRCLQAQTARCWPGIFIVPISRVLSPPGYTRPMAAACVRDCAGGYISNLSGWCLAVDESWDGSYKV